MAISPDPNTPTGAQTSRQPDAAASPAEGSAREAQVEQPDVLPPSRATGEFNALCYTLLSLFAVTFAVWLIFSWMNYAGRYAPLADGWYAGGTRSIEVTLVREDAQRLDCASDVVLEGIHCGYKANGEPFEPTGVADPVRLRPYNTADHVLFLGAGLWSSPGLAGQLPTERFSAVCNFRMVGTIKSVALRWAAEGGFDPVKSPVPVGVVSNCVIPP